MTLKISPVGHFCMGKYVLNFYARIDLKIIWIFQRRYFNNERSGNYHC